MDAMLKAASFALGKLNIANGFWIFEVITATDYKLDS